jgi:hypothetical protein
MTKVDYRNKYWYDHVINFIGNLKLISPKNWYSKQPLLFFKSFLDHHDIL